MKTPELKPCPFCGGPSDFGDDGHIGYAYCTHCLARTDDYYSWRNKNWKEDAARDWNDRVYPPEVQEAVEKQKPKEPKKDIVHYRCPNCDAMLNTYDTCEYCNYCGQKLNWSSPFCGNQTD